jgi:glycosyltransferase involved in cell wall biosynthesis
MSTPTRRRLLVFVVAYNAEKTIQPVLRRIPHSLRDDYDVEVLVIDDASRDETFQLGYELRRTAELPFPLHVLFNPINQGYGGNQKVGFHFAVMRGFDMVALLHGDGQYAPECLGDLVKPIADGEADAVMGSRMLTPWGALRGGMPLYKYVGNRILSATQNFLLGSRLSEFHSGYRVYATEALRAIPFELNTNDFHFDTEILIQLMLAGRRIGERPIPTYYGDEICHVNGLKYASNVMRATLRAKAQDLSLFYDRRFDCAAGRANQHYRPKLDFPSPHQRAVALIPPGARVLDLGCAGGELGAALQAKGCRVTGVDCSPLAAGIHLERFIQHDLDDGPPPIDLSGFEYVLMLDVIEHLAAPERFIERLREAGLPPSATLLVSSANVAFVLVRLSLLVGMFNYGKRGILDLTHTRLFTFSTLRRLFEQGGYDVCGVEGTPVPFPVILGAGRWGRLLLWLNQGLLRLAPRLFSFQAVLTARPRPHVSALLRAAEATSDGRAASWRDGAASDEAAGVTVEKRATRL